jgi:hypothetical protein
VNKERGAKVVLVSPVVDKGTLKQLAQTVSPATFGLLNGVSLVLPARNFL